MAGGEQYRQQLESFEAEYNELSQRYREIGERLKALTAIIQGLQVLVGDRGQVHLFETPSRLLQAQRHAAAEQAAAAQALKREAEERPATAIDLAIEALRRRGRAGMTPKEIEREIGRVGVAVNYYTLYKALRREAERGTESQIRRNGEKFKLTEKGNAPP